jgi:hypothetical protein
MDVWVGGRPIFIDHLVEGIDLVGIEPIPENQGNLFGTLCSGSACLPVAGGDHQTENHQDDEG